MVWNLSVRTFSWGGPFVHRDVSCLPYSSNRHVTQGRFEAVRAFRARFELLLLSIRYLTAYGIESSPIILAV